MQFNSQRRAPYAVAVQVSVVLIGAAMLAAHLLAPPPPPLPCATPAQILYQHHHACLPSADAMFRELAAPIGQDFVRAAYVRDRASGAWLPVPRHVVVEHTTRLVTKD